MTAELHGAFVWDCEECGTENFVRAVEGNLEQTALSEMAGTPVGRLTAPEAVADESDPENPDEPDQYAALVFASNILIAPHQVTCSRCGRVFPASAIDDEELDA